MSGITKGVEDKSQTENSSTLEQPKPDYGKPPVTGEWEKNKKKVATMLTPTDEDKKKSGDA